VTAKRDRIIPVRWRSSLSPGQDERDDDLLWARSHPEDVQQISH
jgi:hypothetical protein